MHPIFIPLENPVSQSPKNTTNQDEFQGNFDDTFDGEFDHLLNWRVKSLLPHLFSNVIMPCHMSKFVQNWSSLTCLKMSKETNFVMQTKQVFATMCARPT